MTTYKAVITENEKKGQVIANTKIGQYKGMYKEEFRAAVYKTTCWSFEVVEIC